MNILKMRCLKQTHNAKSDLYIIIIIIIILIERPNNMNASKI